MVADWGPVVVAVAMFILLSPGLLFQLPARTRVIEFGNMYTSGISILVHAILFFCIYTILIVAIGIHIRSGWFRQTFKFSSPALMLQSNPQLFLESFCWRGILVLSTFFCVSFLLNQFDLLKHYDKVLCVLMSMFIKFIKWKEQVFGPLYHIPCAWCIIIQNPSPFFPFSIYYI